MKARRNPYGLPIRSDMELIRVGEKGVQTHIYDPDKEIVRGTRVVTVGAPLCGSGYKGGKPAPLYRSDAQYVTCTRCIKLLTMNDQRRK